MRMSRNGFIVHFIISLKPDYGATVVYNPATAAHPDTPWKTAAHQPHTTARGADAAHAKGHTSATPGPQAAGPSKKHHMEPHNNNNYLHIVLYFPHNCMYFIFHIAPLLVSHIANRFSFTLFVVATNKNGKSCRLCETNTYVRSYICTSMQLHTHIDSMYIHEYTYTYMHKNNYYMYVSTLSLNQPQLISSSYFCKMFFGR